MADEDRCDQCGEGRPAGEVRRAHGPVRLCEACLAAEDRAPDDPIAAAWDLDEDGVLVERVWPVTVNLHPFHVERALEAGIEAPPTLRPSGGDEGEDA